MTVFFGGTEGDIYQGTTVFGATGTTTEFDTNYSRMATLLNPAVYQVGPASLGNKPEVWWSLRWGTNTPNTGYATTIMEFRNAAGQGILRVRQLNTNLVELQYWSGSAWVTIGSGVSPTFVSATWAVRCLIDGSAGAFQWWVNGVSQASLTGNTNFFSASVDGLYVSAYNQFTAVPVSEHVAADESVLSMRVATIPATGAGTTTNWTSGAFGDINGAAINDATFISSATANQVDTFALQNLSTAAALLTPRAITVAMRGENSVTGPQNVQAAVHTGGVDYFSATLPLFSTSFQSGRMSTWNQNPNTAADWTVSDVNGLEAGAKSIT